jgi:DNA-binding winged helix-turn-helix (wHTH) protein/predicted ATPase
MDHLGVFSQDAEGKYAMIYAFGDYELDTDRYELWCAGRSIALEPQVFQLLVYLIAQRHRVVTKSELIEHLWPQHFVSDNALHQRMTMARRALGDSRQRQTCIKTIRGKGYRFIVPVAEIASRLPREAPAPPHPASVPGFMVAREAELAVLQQCWRAACEGVRQMVFVTGATGIGKTTVVNAFTQQIATTQTVRLGHGQCVDQYGSGEAHMPILEALERLGRRRDGSTVVARLARYAPSWLLQLPSLLTADMHDRLQQQATGATPMRMLRELPHALEQLALDDPIVLVLEDLHWSDPSTLACFAALARRTEPARLLVIGTYRFAEARRYRSELETLVHELQMHDQCRELALTALSEDAVYAYLSARFPGLVGLDDLTRAAYQRTEGHPLFLVTVVNTWVTQGWLQEGRWGWRLQAHGDAWQRAIPLSLQHTIRHQVDQLSPDGQELLAVASVIGDSFSAASVAACRETDLLAEEANCEAIGQRSPFIHMQDEQVWPDGTVTSGYAFSHAMYREVIYAHLPPAQRLVWHRRIAARLEQAYATSLDEVAAQLAMHYEQGRCYPEAITHHQCAALQALTRKGFQEAFGHLTRGLALLGTFPETPERNRHELDIHVKLGPVLMALKGYAAPEVEQTYVRAHQLCQQLPRTSHRFPVLWGLWMVHNVRAELQTACEYGEDLLKLAQTRQQAADLLRAHRGLGTTLKFRGKFPTARTHLQHALARYEETMQLDNETAHYSFDHGSSTHSFMARTLWFLGYPDQALAHNRKALELAELRAHPHTLVNAQLFAAVLYQHRREGDAMLQWAEAAFTLAQQQGIALRIAHGLLYRGCGLAMQGRLVDGIETMHQGLNAVKVTGAALAWSWFLAMLAEAYHQAGRTTEGLRVIHEALAHANCTDERFYEAELYRLKGELLLRAACGVRSAELTPEECFVRALVIARRQEAKSLELRATTSLSRLWQQQRKRTEAHELLAPIYGWFTEGFDTPDLQDAKALLNELSAESRLPQA